MEHLSDLDVFMCIIHEPEFLVMEANQRYTYTSSGPELCVYLFSARVFCLTGINLDALPAVCCDPTINQTAVLRSIMETPAAYVLFL
jgi:hypothetical protein